MLMLVKKLRHETSVMISGNSWFGGGGGVAGGRSSRTKRMGGGQASSGLEDSVDDDSRGCGESEWRLQMRKYARSGRSDFAVREATTSCWLRSFRTRGM